MHNVNGSADMLAVRKEDVILKIENPRGAVGSLDELPHLEKVPSLTVGQRLIGGTMELMSLVHDVTVEIDAG